MDTSVLSSPLSVRQRQLIQESASSASYEAPQSFAPRAYDSAMDNAAGASAFPEIAAAEEESGSKLRRRIGGAAPGAGESHFAPPSDCFG